MKHLKKCAGLVLALVMVLSMAVTAYGTEVNGGEITGSITINGTTAGKVYEIYKIFDLTMANATTVAYTIDENWVAFFEGDGKSYLVDTNSGSLNPIHVDGTIRYINITEENVAKFSQAALAYAAKLTEDASITAEGTTVVFENLPLGYYLVYPQGASEIKDGEHCICSLSSTVPNATVNVKAEYLAIDKEDDAVSADLGQTVTYTITGEVPDTTGYSDYEYTIQDTMSEGLTFQQGVTVIFGQTPIEVTPTYTDNGFTLTFNMVDYQAYKGQPITVVYSAVVNEKALEHSVEKNSATLTYDHDPGENTVLVPNPPVEEEVYTSEIVISKVDGSDNAILLEGAEFVLQKKVVEEEQETVYYYVRTGNVVTWTTNKDEATVVTTDEEGAAEFEGLQNGTYYLEEIKAPDGYNLLTETVEVVVDGGKNNDTSVSVEAVVENNSGTTLPSTGGMGTTVFYAVGSLMMVGAAVLLVARKRTGTV